MKYFLFISVLLFNWSYTYASPNLDNNLSKLDEKPSYVHNQACNWWYDSDGTKSCFQLTSEYAITEDKILGWVSPPYFFLSCTNSAQNPLLLNLPCTQKFLIPKDASVCVDSAQELPAKSKLLTASPVSSAASIRPVPSPTQPSNGISTPKPIQPG